MNRLTTIKIVDFNLMIVYSVFLEGFGFIGCVNFLKKDKRWDVQNKNLEFVGSPSGYNSEDEALSILINSLNEHHETASSESSQ